MTKNDGGIVPEARGLVPGSKNAIRKQFESGPNQNILTSPTTEALPVSPVSVKQMINSYQNRMKNKPTK